MSKRTVSVEQAAQLLGVGRSAMYSAIRRNEAPFPVIRCGRRLVVSVYALEQLLGPLNDNGTAVVGDPVDLKGADDAATLQA